LPPTAQNKSVLWTSPEAGLVDPNPLPAGYNLDAYIIRAGTVNWKEDGFTNWLWRPKWLVLMESTLSIHSTKVNRTHAPIRVFTIIFSLELDNMPLICRTLYK